MLFNGENNHNYKHGYSGTRTYWAWVNIRSRCADLEDSYYGGKGIIVCDRWQESFVNFLEDMGVAPEGTEIDRIDGNGNYEPGNCRWVTRTVNARNSSQSRLGMEAANEIRDLFITGNYERPVLAELFAVSLTIINKVINNKLWKIDGVLWEERYSKEIFQLVKKGRMKSKLKSSKVKLSFIKANEIRVLFKTENYTKKALGKMYGVSTGTIISVIQNKAWKN